MQGFQNTHFQDFSGLQLPTTRYVLPGETHAQLLGAQPQTLDIPQNLDAAAQVWPLLL